MTALKSNGYTSMDNYFWGTNDGSDAWDEEPDTDIGWGGGNSSLTPEGLTSKKLFQVPSKYFQNY